MWGVAPFRLREDYYQQSFVNGGSILWQQLLWILWRCTPEQMRACTSRLFSSSDSYSMHSQG